MTKNIPVLEFNSDTPAGGASSTVQIDSSVDSQWIINLQGTDKSNRQIRPQFVIVDNTGVNSTPYVDYGTFRYSVAPYTRKTFPVLKDQLSIKLVISQGVIPVTFTDYNPGFPDDVNQVASSVGGTSGNNAVWNSADKEAQITLSNSDLTATTPGTALEYLNVRATSFKATGKYYTEFYINGAKSSPGIANATASLGGALAEFIGWDTNGIAYYFNGQVFYNNAAVATNVAYMAGDTIAMAVDKDSDLIWFKKLGQYWNNSPTADPSAGIGGISIAGIAGNVTIAASMNNDAINEITANFGDSPFLGSVPTGYTSGWPL